MDALSKVLLIFLAPWYQCRPISFGPSQGQKSVTHTLTSCRTWYSRGWAWSISDKPVTQKLCWQRSNQDRMLQNKNLHHFTTMKKMPLTIRACLLDNLSSNVAKFLMLVPCLVFITCRSALDVSNFRLTGNPLCGHPACSLRQRVAVRRERRHQSITC